MKFIIVSAACLQVLGQVDKKFIACILDTKGTGGWVGGWIVCAFVPEWDVCWRSVGGG